MVNIRAVQGHNNPPTGYVARKERAEELTAAANVWLKEVKTLEDEDQANKCKDFVDQIRAEAKLLETDRTTEKAPHLEAGREVDGRYNGLKSVLEVCKRRMTEKMTVYLEAQQARIDAEAKVKARGAEKAAQEASEALQRADTVEGELQAAQAADRATDAVKEAAAAVVARAKNKGQYGSKAMSLRTVRQCEVTSPHDAAIFFCGYPEVIELVKVLALRSKADEIPGIKFTETKKAV